MRNTLKTTLAMLAIIGLAMLASIGVCEAQAASTNSVTLAWNPSTPGSFAITNYTVLWGVQSGVYTNSLPTLSGSQTNLTVPTLAVNTTYFFTVYATDAGGFSSANAVEINFKVPNIPPGAPQNLKAKSP